MDITLVYFVYGLAFFVMGVAMMLESGRSPLLAEAWVLRPLAVFGFVHGTHEWLEMYMIQNPGLLLNNPALLGWLRVGLLSISFASLAMFGLLMMEPRRRPTSRQLVQWSSGLGVYTLLTILLGLVFGQGHQDWVSHGDAMVRYLLAFPAAALAGAALFRQSVRAKADRRFKLASRMLWAAYGFLVYSLTQLVVVPADFFPANFLNVTTFIDYAGFPIQVVRALSAVVITMGMIRAMQAVEEERQAQFLAVQQERLEALEQLRKELLEREAMRQELLRHIVIAQEDERARIARELHDETAQLLAAFNLHLASLQDAAPRNPKVREQVVQLIRLSRQMSQGVYRLVRDLRPAQLDDLGLAPALEYLTDEIHKQLGLVLQFKKSGTRYRLDALVETVFFRVAQEALSNVARHAGVTRAEVELIYAPNMVILRVSDQGKGFDPKARRIPPQGWGIAGMSERAESVGGQLLIQSAPGQGTLVKLSVPVPGPLTNSAQPAVSLISGNGHLDNKKKVVYGPDTPDAG